MPCCILLLAVVSPRLALFFLAIFTDDLSRAFDSWWLPLIGFFILPWTTLSYALLYFSGANVVSGIEWFFVAFFFLIDLGSYAGSARGRGQSASSSL